MMFENLQRTIDSFIGDYGTEALIQYLKDFELLNGGNNYKYIDTICALVSQICSVDKYAIFDINNLKPEAVDARRHIVYFVTIYKKLPNKIITALFNCKIRTVYKYQREVKDRIQNLHIYKEYKNQYEQILNAANVSAKY
jgi:hypothetical protein